MVIKLKKLFYHAGLLCLFVMISTINYRSQQFNNLLIAAKVQTSVPRFELSPCAVQVPQGVKTECGNLFVRESRTNKSNSRIIKLPVIIIKSTSSNPAADPLIYTSGGPGVSSLGRASRANNLVPFTKDRDFIIFEQRGTRYAEPSLQCPEVTRARHLNWEQNLNAKKAIQNEVQAAKVCHDRLLREGVDLSAYDSAASAADIEDLRLMLGIKQWNLYGISYSTRLMLNYIREYPQGVRSVILDSVLPPTVNWDESDVDGIVNSLNVLLKNCAQGTKCSAAYPKLKEQLFSVIKSANKKPIVVDVNKDGKSFSVNLDGNKIFDFVYNLLEDTGALSRIPSIIDALSKGNYDGLKPYVEGNLTSEGFIWGMRYSVWCREEMPFQNRHNIAAQATKYPELKGFKVQAAFPEICQVWNVPPAGTIENQPVKSNIPALIFSSEYDPDTPPAWGRLVAIWFPKSFFYEVKSSSHGAINNRCTLVDVTTSFLANPTAKPNDSCLSTIPPIDFK